MTENSRRTAALGLVIGALFGIAGAFAPSASWRGIAWGIDGTALIIATALLTIHHVRQGNELAAAGFLVFAVGEGLIVSGSAMGLTATTPIFGAGAALWAASLAMVSLSGVMPAAIRNLGLIGSFLFALVALQIFGGNPLTPLDRPLPFFAYPFLAATLCGWAWATIKHSG